ncbi:hypothetical protein M378DRAFT_160293 [Amanita muscaria Koide BX008]|uniref:Uncharacterized protein n=1 Tax=Amanita muscaria (strain Koide BX008) TaxID=946122 RepID=A0A0C2STT2_AMAMK|nr:hypothetical protein M378DRAFT_160293 [Amanita muscaria Koide BX008]
MKGGHLVINADIASLGVEVVYPRATVVRYPPRELCSNVQMIFGVQEAGFLPFKSWNFS